MLQRETGPFLIQEGSDWHECNRLLLLPGNAQISTAALFSCLGTDWSSPNGAAWGLSEVDSHSRLCFSNSEALKHKSSLSLSLDFLELVVWNRKEVIGMTVIDFVFCRRTLTVLYVSSWQSVGCQHTFPELEAYHVAIPLKSRQKQSAGGYALCQWRRPKILSRSVSTPSLPPGVPHFYMSLVDHTAILKSQAHPWTHLLGPLLVHSYWSTWVLVVFWQRFWSFRRRLSTPFWKVLWEFRRVPH